MYDDGISNNSDIQNLSGMKFALALEGLIRDCLYFSLLQPA
jgi:hypothetical protein